MKEDNKIPLSVLKERFDEQIQPEDPEQSFDTALYGWIRHPRYFSPHHNLLRQRKYIAGEAWLTEQEILSLESYLGNCKLL